MNVGALVPFSTTDYPGQLAAVLFCQGCPWRCRYCHNPHLQQFIDRRIQWTDVLTFLKSRIGLLDAVVFSGGEPLAQPDLPVAIQQVRDLGFKVGLHTACAVPKALPAILPLLDWIGLDVKMVPARYEEVTGVCDSGKDIEDCLRKVTRSGVDCEIRTTFHPALLSETDLLNLALLLKAHGIRNFVVQTFRAKGCADVELNQASECPISRFTSSQLREMFGQVTIR